MNTNSFIYIYTTVPLKIQMKMKNIHKFSNELKMRQCI